MAFKPLASNALVPGSPDKLFRDLTRRKFPDVLPHEAEIMQAYAALPHDRSDVAPQLPPGSGKTLARATQWSGLPSAVIRASL